MAESFSIGAKLMSLEDERNHIKTEVERRAWERRTEIPAPSHESLISETLGAYKHADNKALLHEKHALGQVEAGVITLDLSPRKTDEQIERLIHLLHEKGIWNTLQVVEGLHNRELEDDFHRFLVQYLKAGFVREQIERKGTLFEALQMTLYEIMLPSGEHEESKEPLKELLSSMEQFYAGVASVLSAKDERTLSFELTVPNKGHEMVAYAAVPDQYRDLFEKQLLSIFPEAKLREEKNDYNIFKEHDHVAASVAEQTAETIFPIKLYDQFDYDPFNVISNAFSKIAAEGEGAAIQIKLHKAPIDYLAKYKKALDDISKGTPLKDAIDIRGSAVGEAAKELKHGLTEVFFGTKRKEDKELGEKERAAIESIKRKIESPIILASLCIVVSAGTKERAESILLELEAAFRQFENTNGNAIRFKRVKEMQAFIRDFSFRLFNQSQALPLSLKELATIFHVPKRGIEGTPFVKQSHAVSAPAPHTTREEGGVLIGVNRHRNVETEAYLSAEDRLRHFYVVGQTGTGKTGLLKNMITQDILRGEGVCMIDPHGSDILDVLSIIPKERYEDVIYFDPAYTARPMGLNMLEFNPAYPEQKTFIVNELLAIFNKLFDMKTSGGPAFEQYFRNSALLVMAHPESGNTLVEVARVLSDKAFRDLKLSHVTDPLLLQFWKNAEQTKGEADMANFAQYVTNKFDQFLSNEIMRPVIAQEHSAFNFREVMDQKKILLVNLSKGRLGDLNASLIGLVLVGKILMAALSRADAPGKNLPPFYLYIDEFQNITTDSIQTILSEARKYKLSLTIAHQFMKQIDEKTRDAVIGNVGSMAVFRVGADDAEYLEKQFTPVFSAKDIMNLDNREAYIKMLIHGVPARPFNIRTTDSIKGNPNVTATIQAFSYQKYGVERSEIEATILKKYSLI